MMTVRSSLRARTPSITRRRDETIRIYTGNAFDVAGERKRSNYTVEKNAATEDLRDQSPQPQERTSRSASRRTSLSWQELGITAKSDDYQKKDSQTIEFPVKIAPDGEKVITYTAHYTW